VQRHGINRQLQRTASGSIPHDRVTIPQMCSSRSLALDRPRQSALRYPAVLSNRASTYIVRRQPAPIYAPLRSHTTSAIVPPTISHSARGTQIPITHAAPPTYPFPRFSSLGGLRTPAPLPAAPSSRGRHPKTFTETEVEGCLTLCLLCYPACVAATGSRRSHDRRHLAHRAFRPAARGQPRAPKLSDISSADHMTQPRASGCRCPQRPCCPGAALSIQDAVHPNPFENCSFGIMHLEP
jgi:hypothetical protein